MKVVMGLVEKYTRIIPGVGGDLHPRIEMWIGELLGQCRRNYYDHK